DARLSPDPRDAAFASHYELEMVRLDRGVCAAAAPHVVQPSRRASSLLAHGQHVQKLDFLSAGFLRLGDGDFQAGPLRAIIRTSADAKPAPPVHSSVSLHRRLAGEDGAAQGGVALGDRVRTIMLRDVVRAAPAVPGHTTYRMAGDHFVQFLGASV